MTLVGEKGEGTREAVSLLRPYPERRHGDWDNYSGLKGNSTIGDVGGKYMARHMSSQ